MNTYLVMKNKHQKEVDAFPLKFAFSNKQFEEAMAEWGLTPNDTDKIYKLSGTGGFYLRTDSDRLLEMFERHSNEMQTAIDADKTGEGFIFDMFNYELANHEYVVTYDIEPTLDALGITYKEIEKEPRLMHGLALAKKRQLQDEEAENDIKSCPPHYCGTCIPGDCKHNQRPRIDTNCYLCGVTLFDQEQDPDGMPIVCEMCKSKVDEKLPE